MRCIISSTTHGIKLASAQETPSVVSTVGQYYEDQARRSPFACSTPPMPCLSKTPAACKACEALRALAEGRSPGKVAHRSHFARGKGGHKSWVEPGMRSLRLLASISGDVCTQRITVQGVRVRECDEKCVVHDLAAEQTSKLAEER